MKNIKFLIAMSVMIFAMPCEGFSQKWLEKNDPIELSAFFMDAVNYGLIS